MGFVVQIATPLIVSTFLQYIRPSGLKKGIYLVNLISFRNPACDGTAFYPNLPNGPRTLSLGVWEKHFQIQIEVEIYDFSKHYNEPNIPGKKHTIQS